MTESAQDSTALVLNTEWLSLAETMEKTHKSASTIERWVGIGILPSKLEPRPARKPERLYAATAVDRLAQQIKSKEDVRAVVSARPQGPTEIAIANQTFDALGDLVTRLVDAPRRPPLTEVLWLTLSEATLLSGIPKGALKQLVREEKIASCRFGRALRIRRASLQAFAG